MHHEYYIEQLRNEIDMLRMLNERHVRLVNGLKDLLKSFCWDEHGPGMKDLVERLIEDDKKAAK